MADPFFLKVGTAKPTRRVNRAAESTAPAQAAPDALKASAPSDASQRRWTAADAVFWAANQTYDRLPAGLYRCGDAPNIGPYLAQIRCDTDDLLELPDSASAEVLAEIRRFWQLEGDFRRHGFLHKRGVLLWGPPGSGKTATLQQLVSLIVREHEGIGIFIDHPGIAAKCFQMVRRIEPKRPIVALLEDLDALVETHGENEYLALLDGESQIANVVYVATTNYPERLDRRFVDRPSRFDAIKMVGMPSPAARRAYLEAREPSLTENELAEWVALSDGFSIAHLREMIILCRCYRKPLAEAVARLEAMRQEAPRSEKADDGVRGGAGFLGGRTYRPA